MQKASSEKTVTCVIMSVPCSVAYLLLVELPRPRGALFSKTRNTSVLTRVTWSAEGRRTAMTRAATHSGERNKRMKHKSTQRNKT